MKYFENFSKTNFESSIGTFKVSDFFTYIDVDQINLITDNVNVDSKTTLLEAAYNVYDDANSFWIFLIANKTINPFDLLEYNTVLFKNTNEDKINFLLYSDSAGTTGIAFPQGSIIVPYTANTGASSSWSSVGNFNLYGPLAVVDAVSYYDGNMVIKGQKGSTADFVSSVGPTGDHLCVIYPTTEGYTLQTSVYTGTKTTYLDTVIEIKKPQDGRTIFKSAEAAYDTIDQLQPDPSPVEATQIEQISNIQSIEKKSKNIKAFVKSDLGYLRSQFITVKYN